MADKTQTYLTSDWNIWTYKPFDDRFILNFSELNDATTPLSATDGSVEILDCLIGNIAINEGSPVNGIFNSIGPATMSATLVVENFSTTDSRRFLVGSTIWVTLRNGQTVDNTYLNLGKNTPYFMGRIRSFNVSVQPGSDIATINLECSSTTEDNLNTLISIDKDTTTPKFDLIYYAIEPYGFQLSGSSANSFYFGNGDIEVKTYGEWILDYITCDSLVIADTIDIIGASGSSWPFKNQLKYKTGRGSSAHTFGEDEIVGVELDWSGAESPTGVSLTLAANSAINYQIGAISSGDNIGMFNYTNTLDVKDLSELIVAGQRMLSQTAEFAPVNISTIVATNNQDIIYEDRLGLGQWFWPINLRKPMDTITVDLPTLDVDAQRMLIVGRSMLITPDNWTCDYQLYKGLPAYGL